MAKSYFFRGYSEQEIRDCFDRVIAMGATPNDWRAPICSLLDEDEDAMLVAAAIEFFTATEATFRVVPSSKGDRRIVEAVGYRAGPAGP